MISFLYAIAQGYKDQYPDISKLTFIMPNKRSGAYLLRAFSYLCDQPQIGPRVIPISDFINEVADHVIDSKIDLLFRLYESYRKETEDDNRVSFDKFCSWGDTIISDFNEIDLQMVNSQEIFKNIFDLNAIKSNFLTTAQKKVMVKYFGYTPEIFEKELNSFWQQFSKNEDQEGVEEKESFRAKKKFLSLWQLLPVLYKDFKERLAESGLTTTGGAYKETALKIEDGYEPYPGEKLIFVGFNALSEAEARIFSALKSQEIERLAKTGKEKETKADFIWDFAPALFANNDEPALRFVEINARNENFPSPPWMDIYLKRAIPRNLPNIKVVAVPSNVMQVKVAAKEIGKTDIHNKRLVVVLPDESLLMPLLHSLPKECGQANLTMGFPLKQTPVIGFAYLLRKLHSNQKGEGRDAVYTFEDVKDLLAHPYAKKLFKNNEITKFIKLYSSKRRMMVPVSSLSRLGDNSSSVFRVFESKMDPKDVIDYILRILTILEKTITENTDNKSATEEKSSEELEKIYITTYADALIRLRNCLENYHLELTPREVLYLTDRAVGNDTVTIDNQPLQGLQIMGVLETRCLEFDEVIMLSVNEKIIPRVGRSSTFIPNVIRSAFGMPPANYQEELFSYYFYRVLGRSQKGILTYDARSSENRTPGPSRYILQMKHLVEGLKFEEEEMIFDLPKGISEEVVVKKTPELQRELERYIVPENITAEQLRAILMPRKLREKEKNRGNFPEGFVNIKKFSASALSHFFKCPLQFIYGNVLELGEQREKMETIDAIDFGTIVHQIIEHLYFDPEERGILLEHPKIVTKAFLEGLLNEKELYPDKESRIERETRLAILEVHFGHTEDKIEKRKLEGSPAVLYDYIIRYVKNIIEADIEQAPFRLWGSEIDQSLIYSIPTGKEGDAPLIVILNMVIDRLDQEGESGPKAFRIVDYKTGAVHLKAESFNEVFDGTVDAANIFQLLFYATLLVILLERKEVSLSDDLAKEELERNLKFLIYKVPALPLPSGLIVPEIGGEKIQTLGEFKQLEEKTGKTVMETLESVIRDILDKALPLYGRPTEEKCGMCEFRLQCESMRAKKEEG